jgi:hypothetical protein
MRGLVVALAALAGACGYVGPPLPPALNIPSPATGVRAIEYGPYVLVEFMLPPLTTDGLPLTGVRSVDLYIGPAPSPFNADVWVAGAQHFQVPVQVAATEPGPARHEVPAQPWIGQQVTIGVRSTGRTGRVSDWSNFEILQVDTPLAQPGAPALENVREGVSLSWTGAAPRYRVMRSVGGEDAVLLGETGVPSYLDQTTVYGTTYTYLVVGVASDTQQSLPSGSASITPADIFPPAAPTGLRAVAGPQSIELSWTRNGEPDFAGYRIFRSAGGGPFVMLRDELDAPAFSDRDIAAGGRYTYAVEAIDMLGNVSARSETASATIP